jgi:hypothetical protein
VRQSCRANGDEFLKRNSRVLAPAFKRANSSPPIRFRDGQSCEGHNEIYGHRDNGVEPFVVSYGGVSKLDLVRLGHLAHLGFRIAKQTQRLESRLIVVGAKIPYDSGDGQATRSYRLARAPASGSKLKPLAGH